MKSHKLTDQQVAEINERLADGERVTHLAKEYGVSYSTISRRGRQMRGDDCATFTFLKPEIEPAWQREKRLEEWRLEDRREQWRCLPKKYRRGPMFAHLRKMARQHNWE